MGRLSVLTVLLLSACFVVGCTGGNAPAPTGQPAPAAPSSGGGPGGAAAASSPGSPQIVATKAGIEMVSLPGGEFTMGDDQGEDDEKPAHPVRVSPFLMDRCEVTQELYRSLMGENPAKFAGPDRPVERVSWLAAIRFCNMRSLREGLKPCYDLKTQACDFQADGYRLPTEAEWEYACRAGGSGRYSFGADAGPLPRYAWFKGNAAKTTHPVKQKEPNSWGLYDMHGNVAEWCHDFTSESYAPQGDAQDPRGPSTGEERVLRGGSWSSNEEACRSSARAGAAPVFADVCFGSEAFGFRCVRRPAASSPAASAAKPADK